MKWCVHVFLLVVWFVAPAHPAFASTSENYQLPDVTLHTFRGDSISLLTLCRQRTTLLTVAYSRCVGVCYPLLFSLRDGLSAAGNGMKDVQVLVVSFDERDTRENVAAMAEVVRVRNDIRWTFATLDNERVRSFCDSLHLIIRFDSIRGLYDHQPYLAAVNQTGVIMSTLQQPEITLADLWRLYRDAKNEFIPVLPSATEGWTTCFTYDPRTDRYVISWGLLILYLPVFLGVVIVLMIFRFARKKQYPAGVLTRTEKVTH